MRPCQNLEDMMMQDAKFEGPKAELGIFINSVRVCMIRKVGNSELDPVTRLSVHTAINTGHFTHTLFFSN